MKVKGFGDLDVADVKITFERSLPANLSEIAQILRDAKGADAVSTQSAVKMLHAGDEWTEEEVKSEVDAIRREQARQARDSVLDDFDEME